MGSWVAGRLSPRIEGAQHDPRPRSGEGVGTATRDQGGEGTTWRPQWTPDDIRRLPTGHALALSRRAAPLEIALRPYWER